MDKRRRKMLTWVLGLAVIVLVGLIGGRYVYNEYHTYHNPSVRDYEATIIENDPYEIRTLKKEVLGNAYVGFSIYEVNSENLIYQCPDLFLVKELEAIEWGEETFDILVKRKGRETVTYEYSKGWRS